MRGAGRCFGRALRHPLQQQIVADKGNINRLILAGPGSGKTRTLVARIGWLIATKAVRPEQVLAADGLGRGRRRAHRGRVRERPPARPAGVDLRAGRAALLCGAAGGRDGDCRGGGGGADDALVQRERRLQDAVHARNARRAGELQEQLVQVLAEGDGTGHAENFARVQLAPGTEPGSIVTIVPERVIEGLLA